MTTNSESNVSRRGFARSLLAALPTIAVLAVLGLVAAWGHHTGWKAPKLAQLFGEAPKEQAEDWCTQHNVPESICIACYPELVGEDVKDWCPEHGLPESKCTICHPEILLTGVAGDWCREHGLPESSCTLCHPDIARKGELPIDGDATIVSADAAARKPRDPSTCQTHALKVQFASVAAMTKSGVRLGQVIERPMSDSVFANAQVDYDRTRYAKLAPRAPGTAWRVDRDVGQTVRAGDVLALIESAAAGSARIELLRAQSALDVAKRAAERVQASSEAGFRTEAERVAAEAGVRQTELQLADARRALSTLGLGLPTAVVDETSLANLGLPESVATTLASAPRSLDLFALVAPFDGVVVARDVVAGEIVDPSRTLFEIADPSRMRITMDVSEADARLVSIGEEVVFRSEGARDDAIRGRVTWISTSVDETTRTVQVRADADNAEGVLRAHTFGTGRIVVRRSPTAIAVASEALQWEGCCFVVFVRLADGIFQTRKVRLGAKDAAYTEILGGLLPGEVVVTDGSHVLKSEILKSNLGAGCCVE